ncbi:MAG: GntR family transcriptional regulator, partial [Blastochloris sp.]|nr:GntR family transcriptional regulator [Blastochloris sp.]
MHPYEGPSPSQLALSQLKALTQPDSLNRALPLQRQLCGLFRSWIRQGHLPAGTRLPTSQDMGQLFGTTHLTVNRALKQLMDEGLLERKRKVGTTVRALPTSRTIGIYVPHNFLSSSGSNYFILLTFKLQEMIEASGRHAQIWIDTRSPQEHHHPLPDLQRAAEHREILGFAVPIIGAWEYPWLRQLPVPIVGPSSLREVRSPVESDYDQLFQSYFRILKQRKLQHVALITPFPRPKSKKELLEWHKFFEPYDDNLRDFDLKTRREWEITCAPPCDHATYGRHALLELWKQKQRPQALVVYPETVVLGVLQAIWELGPECWENLQLCLHRNESSVLPVPFPVLWAETSVTELAKCLLRSLDARIEGRIAPSRTLLPFAKSKKNPASPPLPKKQP